jgi:iron complex transport system ATP-binding protein
MNLNLIDILTLDSLKIGYKSGGEEKVLLPPLNARAKSGELIAVIGRNGIGKSTLLKTLTGLHQALGGEIYISGKNIRDHTRTELASNVSYISTEIIKVSNMRVYDLVSLGRYPYINWMGKIDKENHMVIMDALEKTSMSSFINRFISELSDGERQRTMIARILAQDTGIMIMDEPTAFLDISGKYEILNLMHLITQESGKTIIFSTHDLNMAITKSDKIWLILDDKLIEGGPEDLMIGREFACLFDSSSVQLDSENGTFVFRSSEKGKIYIQGEGIRKHWVENAIRRAGFSTSFEKTIPYVSIPDQHRNDYQLITTNSVEQFDSIYDLVTRLRK